ncbi:hypothetical protein SUDANB145_07376 (plasmid) [Streptomyces sp. enrichment culture]
MPSVGEASMTLGTAYRAAAVTPAAFPAAMVATA